MQYNVPPLTLVVKRFGFSFTNCLIRNKSSVSSKSRHNNLGILTLLINCPDWNKSSPFPDNFFFLCGFYCLLAKCLCAPTAVFPLRLILRITAICIHNIGFLHYHGSNTSKICLTRNLIVSSSTGKQFTRRSRFLASSQHFPYTDLPVHCYRSKKYDYAPKTYLQSI